MLSYYMELISKPVYKLSTSEKLFVDIFPFLVLGAICAVVVIICWIVERVKK